MWRKASTASADRSPSGTLPSSVEGGEDRRVAGRARHDGHAGVVLRRGADHRRAADVDLLDELVERDPGPLGGRGERVEVDDDELERSDRRGRELAPVVDPAPVGQDPGVDPRMERLDPSVEHLRKARHGGDVGHGQARRRAASGPSRRSTRARSRGATRPAPELDQAGLVAHRQERPARDRDGGLGALDVDRDRAPPGSTRIAPARASATARGRSRCSTARMRSWRRRLVVAGQDRDGLLGDDRAAVEGGVDEMDRGAADARTVGQRVADGVPAGERRQERRDACSRSAPRTQRG